MKLRVGLIFGGRSAEHEISVASATSIVRALDPARYEVALIAVDASGRWHLGAPGTQPALAAQGAEVTLPAKPGARALLSVEHGRALAELDVAFPIIHGSGGEDGALQGFLELAGLPYVGAGVLGSALQMDKDVSKRLLRAENIPVVPWHLVRAHEFARDARACAARALAEIGLPAFVKPANSGSSVGIAKVKRAEELAPKLRDALQYDDKVLVEQAVDAREIELAVLGNDAPEISAPGEIVPRAEWYDYRAKYDDADTELHAPATLDDEILQRLQSYARKAFRVLEGAGLARVDFFVERGGTGARVYLNEVNSLPGFTEVSMYPRLWQVSGLSFSALLSRLIELALERGRAREKLRRTRSR